MLSPITNNDQESIVAGRRTKLFSAIVNLLRHSLAVQFVVMNVKPPDASRRTRQFFFVGIPSGSVVLKAPAGNAIPAILERDHEPWIAIIASDLYPLFQDARAGLTRRLDPAVSTVIPLVPYRRPPTDSYRRDGHANSFLCSGSVFAELLKMFPEACPESLCYLLLKAILDGKILVDRVTVTQLPARAPKPEFEPLPSARVIMPHRGFARDLRTALRSIDLTREPRPAVSVGLDGGALTKYQALRDRNPRVEFLYFSPTPVGPYVIRQELIQRSDEPVLIFQDSDDFATWDRFHYLQQELRANSCDLVGSHQLRVNEMLQSVEIFRYPLNVNEALRTHSSHALLHPTSAVTRSGFFEAGGLSTDKIFDSDSQFVLRASFMLRILNVDAFLYVRRVHKLALTVHPSTRVGSAAREPGRRQRAIDFEAIKSGRMSLDESSLWPCHRTAPYQVRAL